MIDLNQPNVNGVGVFFAVCRTAIGSTQWARADFKAVELVEGQLEYLEKYCKSVFSGDITKPQEAPVEKEKVELTKDTNEPAKSSPEPKSEASEETDEIVDVDDKGEKRKIKMPDSILDKVMMGVEATKNFEKNPPADPVQVSPLPASPDEYDNQL